MSVPSGGPNRVNFERGERLSATKLNELSSLVDQSLTSRGSPGIAVGSFGTAYSTPQDGYLWVRVTDVRVAEGSPSGEQPHLLYSFQEVVEDQVTGEYLTKVDGIIGLHDVNPLVEVNNRRVDPDTVVLAWKGLGDHYYFVADNASVRWVRPDEQHDNYPMYDGTKVWFDPQTRQFKELGDCYVIEANRDELVAGRRYLARYSGLYDGTPLYVTSCCEGEPPADPFCDFCEGEVPVTYTVTVADFTGFCEYINGEHVLDWVGPSEDGCEWFYSNGEDPESTSYYTIRLLIDEDWYRLLIQRNGDRGIPQLNEVECEHCPNGQNPEFWSFEGSGFSGDMSAVNGPQEITTGICLAVEVIGDVRMTVEVAASNMITLTVESDLDPDNKLVYSGTLYEDSCCEPTTLTAGTPGSNWTSTYPSTIELTPSCGGSGFRLEYRHSRVFDTCCSSLSTTYHPTLSDPAHCEYPNTIAGTFPACAGCGAEGLEFPSTLYLRFCPYYINAWSARFDCPFTLTEVDPEEFDADCVRAPGESGYPNDVVVRQWQFSDLPPGCDFNALTSANGEYMEDFGKISIRLSLTRECMFVLCATVWGHAYRSLCAELGAGYPWPRRHPYSHPAALPALFLNLRPTPDYPEIWYPNPFGIAAWVSDSVESMPRCPCPDSVAPWRIFPWQNTDVVYNWKDLTEYVPDCTLCDNPPLTWRLDYSPGSKYGSNLSYQGDWHVITDGGCEWSNWPTVTDCVMYNTTPDVNDIRISEDYVLTVRVRLRYVDDPTTYTNTYAVRIGDPCDVDELEVPMVERGWFTRYPTKLWLTPYYCTGYGTQPFVPPPPDECSDCGDTPTYWFIHVEGPLETRANYMFLEGMHRLDQDLSDPCRWYVLNDYFHDIYLYKHSGSVYRLQLTPDAIYEFTLDGDDCCKPYTATRVVFTDFLSAPDEITVYPSCDYPHVYPCTLCDTVPATWSFSVDGFGGDCAIFNRLYTLTQSRTEHCAWRDQTPNGYGVTLRIKEGRGELDFVFGSGYTIRYTFYSTDCCASHVANLTSTTNPCTGSVPSSVTLISSCYTPGPDPCGPCLTSETPDTFPLLLSGFTGDYAVFNGVWVLERDPGNDCGWVFDNGTVEFSLGLATNTASLSMFTTGIGVHYQETFLTIPYSCCEAITFDLLSASGGVGTVPSTVSSTSSCAQCGYCTGATPDAWTATLAGFTDGCAAYNGDWTFSRRPGYPCHWIGTLNGKTLRLEVAEFDAILVDHPLNSELSYMDTSGPYSCAAPITLTNGFNLCGGDVPTTVTLTPSF